MHVCLTCIELFGDSIYGGFGRAARFIGRELVRRGVQVSMVVPRRSKTYPDRFELDGIAVLQYPPWRPWEAIDLFRRTGAQVYHSQDTSLGTALAQIAAPSEAHVVTFRDPWDHLDWELESAYAGQSPGGWALYRLFIGNPLITRAIRRADARYCAAEFLIPKAARLYGLEEAPGFLPSPVHLRAETTKAERPTVCYVGRWDGRKRVELFLDLAAQCPDVEFIAVGAARDPARDSALRERYRGIPNLRLTGMLDQFVSPEWSDVLAKSWILVNPSPREGLPTTFIEAAAHRCAILSFTDPEGFATRFGLRAREGELKAGLLELLRDNRWRSLGQRGQEYVAGVFAAEVAMEAHLRAYERAIHSRSHGRSRR